jgi:SH3-like domain-containing protein
VRRIRDAAIFAVAKPMNPWSMNTMHPRRAAAAALLLLGAALVPAAAAREGAPLPRFASLRSDEVNLRAGPGTQYPVEWVFLRRDLPVEIVAEYGRWRKVRDVDGSEGWMHQSLLSSRRWVMIKGAVRPLYLTPTEGSEAVLRAEPGVLGRLLTCLREWCRVEIAGHKAWLPRRHLWGVYPEEDVE